MKRCYTLFFLLISMMVHGQKEQPVTGADLLLKNLPEGSRNYLVYMEKPDGSVIDISIWERKVTFSQQSGNDVIEIRQTWKNQNASKVKHVYSVLQKDSFLPLYHKVSDTKNIEAYSFTGKRIVGTDTVPNNTRADFEIKLEKPVFNFELDMEILRMLPYEDHVTFLIPFYHPGSKTPPRDYKYTVMGREHLNTGLGKILCWKLKIEYSERNIATFWIADTSRDLIMMEEVYGPVKRYKKLMY